MTLLDDLLTKVQSLDQTTKAAVVKQIEEQTKDLVWVPNPGPQSDAYFSKADVLLYGGQGGGGKSDLGLGLAFTSHKRSLILRRQYTNLIGLTDRAIKINGTRKGFSGSPPPRLTTQDGRIIQFGANQLLGDEQAWQGQPFDLKYFDEATQFLELQIRFHLGWLRDAEESQRVRAVLGTNPPVTADGDWIVGMFRPWLDLTHSRYGQVKPGELLWYITVPNPNDPSSVMDIEIPAEELGVDQHGRRPVQRDGQTLYAKSRTFIPAALADNPFLANTNYQSELDALPEPIRSAVRDGNFMATRKDADWQVIPTQWVLEAQARWHKDGWKEYAMTAIGFDPAGGGKDSAALVKRHNDWFSEFETFSGKETADGSKSAAMIIEHRRDNCAVIVDVGGGYGGSVCMRLRDNGIPHTGFNGAHKTGEKTKDRQLRFVNTRALAYWRLREALDPGQEGGSHIKLPPDQELRAELTAPIYEPTNNGIKIEAKESIRARLGRSPDKADAVVMAWANQDVLVRKAQRTAVGADRPKWANVGYLEQKRKNRHRRR